MVSVIIPTYNRANYIDRAIRSVLNQTYQDFEIIVVDDNEPNSLSRDLLEEKMKKYEKISKIRYIQHEKNKNGAVARNTGIKVAKGEYITFLDDDDYFLPKRLEIMIKELENNSSFDCAYSSSIVTRKKKIIGQNLAIKSGKMKKELLLGSFTFGTGSNMFFRASAIRKINGFDETFIRHQDIETMIRYFNIGDLLAVKQYLVVKTQDDRSNEPNINKLIQIKKNYFKAFNNEIEELNNQEENIFFSNNYMQIANACIRAKQKKNFIKFKNKASKYKKITNKEKIYTCLLWVNNYVKIEKVKYLIERIKIMSRVDLQTRKAIKYYENYRGE